ncbi:hypothetical protein RN001_005746 [Aquatica leii]|uniref:Uncharacterized protein n=1 Tax=Aquatica leii TaxID=1421715 RepID=A0AAN7Q1P9_9COLE|nr:hypothetical protein RN001_005746 [Aquatica leii]
MIELTLNNLLAELEEDIHGTFASHDIAILPPTNANDDLTDEDSGDEQDLSINNLPASQLLAEAELFSHELNLVDEDKKNNVEDFWDESDELPLSEFIKIRRKNNRTYKWEKSDFSGKICNTWNAISSAAFETSPPELFFKFFTEDIIDMLIKKQDSVGNNTFSTLLDDIGVDLPLKLENHLQQLEAYIVDKNHFFALASYYSTLGDRDFAAHTSAILKFLLSLSP